MFGLHRKVMRHAEAFLSGIREVDKRNNPDSGLRSIYFSPFEGERKPGESLEEYATRVPLTFQPVQRVTKSYRGKDI